MINTEISDKKLIEEILILPGCDFKNPDFKLGEIAEVRLRRLPKGAQVSVGEKNKFRREWKLQFNQIENLTFTIPNELKEKQKIEQEIKETNTQLNKEKKKKNLKKKPKKNLKKMMKMMI